MTAVRISLILFCAGAAGIVIWGVSDGSKLNAAADEAEERERDELERRERAELEELDRRERAEQELADRRNALEREAKDLLRLRDELRERSHEIRKKLESNPGEDARRSLEDALSEIRAEGEQIERQLKELDRKFRNQEREPARNDRERLRAQLEVLERAIAEQREAGNEEEAEELLRRAREIAEHLERGDRDHDERRRPERANDFERRIHHIHAAVENLQAAGLHDHAEELQQVAERMIDEFRDRQHHREAERRDSDEHARDDLRIEVRQLREELFELRRIVKELVDRERREEE